MKTFHIETRQLAQLGVLCINPPPFAVLWAGDGQTQLM